MKLVSGLLIGRFWKNNTFRTSQDRRALLNDTATTPRALLRVELMQRTIS